MELSKLSIDELNELKRCITLELSNRGDALKIYNFCISVRTLNVLAINNISTLGELSNMTKIEFLSLRYSGRHSYKELSELLIEKGLFWKDGNHQLKIQNACLVKNDYILYIGGSTSKYLTKGRKYRLTCSPYREYVSIVNDNGGRVVMHNRLFDTI